MRTSVHLSVPSGLSFCVVPGDTVKKGQAIARTDQKNETDTVIPIARLLSIRPALVQRSMKKRIADTVKEGDVLAQKKRLFSSFTVRSPKSGRIKAFDMKEGSVIITCLTETKQETVTTPVSGKVVRTGKTIEIEVLGAAYRGVKGEGKQTSGPLVVFEGAYLESFNIHVDVAGCVILASSLGEDAAVKLDVLGAVGCIVEKPAPFSSLTWISVPSDVSSVLKKSAGKTILLLPEKKEIIVESS